MLIPLKDLKDKYDLKVKSILHAGAHLAEEMFAYALLKPNHVWWVEANPVLVDKLQHMFETMPGQDILEACVSDEVGKEITFHVANNGQSSSMLELGTHQYEHPDVHYVEDLHLVTTTINDLDAVHDFSDINFLNLDLQGAELLALRGATNILEHVDYIYTEVNERDLYRDCALIGDLNSFLVPYGFKIVEKEMTQHGWGDAFFAKESAL